MAWVGTIAACAFWVAMVRAFAEAQRCPYCGIAMSRHPSGELLSCELAARDGDRVVIEP